VWLNKIQFQTVDCTHSTTDGNVTARVCNNLNLKISIAQNGDNVGGSELLEFSDKT
jgi:hypothetical protein